MRLIIRNCQRIIIRSYIFWQKDRLSAMENLAERIQQRLDYLGLSAEAASIRAGSSRDLIRGIFRGNKTLRADKAKRLAEVLQVSVAWLEHGIGPADEFDSDGSDEFGIPEYDVRIEAGALALASVKPDADNVVKARWALPEDFVRHELRTSRAGLMMVEVLGDSMEPTLSPGDRVLIDTKHKSPSPPGIYAIYDGFGVVVKRLELVPGSEPISVKLISDHPGHSPYISTVDEAHIMGRVVCKITTL
jgi:phage repressor protein C with HTH and peptisase S24 domain